MGGASGTVSETSSLSRASKSVDEADVEEIRETVEEQARNYGYELDVKETNNGFIATTDTSLGEAIGTEKEAIRVKYDRETDRLYFEGATRTGGEERGLAELLDNHL
ncbi:MAG: hypothetical protein ABEJ07_01595 [Candidatus Nanohaloarchaea archaeon]